MEGKTIHTCYESPDIEKLDIILQNQEFIKSKMRPKSFEGKYAFSFATLTKYRNKHVDGKIEVNYKQKNSKGRMFAKGSLSMQSFPREIRGTVAKSIYHDLDMINAHPVILHHICKEMDIECENLGAYIKNRDQFIKEILDCNPDQIYEDIKGAILAVMNGGNKQYNELNKTKWLTDFKTEITGIHNVFSHKYPKQYEKLKKSKPENTKGSLMNHILCEYENKLLNSIVEYLKKKEIIDNDYVLCFDGIMIPRKNGLNINKIIKKLENYLNKKHDIDIKLKEKEMVEIDLSALTLKPKIIEYFKPSDNYYWLDFVAELTKQIWSCIEDLDHYVELNINRVMVRISTGDIYIKKDKKEPLQYVDNVDKFLISYSEKGKPDITCSFRKLFDSKFINRVKIYNNLVLRPTSPEVDVEEENKNSRDFNTWTGFQASLLKEECVDMNLITPILNHIKEVWAADDNKRFHYICSWFHNIFKYPYQKTKVAMVFYSNEQQIGKSIITEHFLIPFVFGSKLSSCEDGLRFASERFNNRLMSKLFVVCEELNTLEGSYQSTFDTLKKIITGKTIQIEIKGGAKFEIDDFMNLILFTNNEFSVKIEKSDARYFITECSAKYHKNFKYFDKLASTFNQTTADHFYSYLYHMKNPSNIKDIPETKLKKEMKLYSMPNPMKFIYRVHEVRESEEEPDQYSWQDQIKEKTCIKSTDFYNCYTRFCKQENEKEWSQTKFARCISNLIEKKRSASMRGYDLETIKIQ